MLKDREKEIELMARKAVQMKESSLRTAILIVDVLLARDQMDKEEAGKRIRQA